MLEPLSILTENIDFGKTTTFSIIEKMNGLGAKTLQVEAVKVLPEEKELIKNHTFFDVKTFLGYINKYKTAHTTIYTHIDENKLYCMLNECEITGGAEIINCNIDGMKLMREIKLAEDIDNAEAFLSFIKERRRKFNNFMELYSLMSSVKVCSSIEKTDIKGKKSENSFIVKHTVMGQEKGEPKEFPDHFEFDFDDMSMGGDEARFYTIYCDVYYSVNSENDMVLEIIVSNKEKLIQDFKNNCQHFLVDNVPEGVLVVAGKPNLIGLLRE